MNFQITALELSAEDLAAAGGRRMVATKNPGYPCRVSLADADVGQEVVLLNYEHQSADTPFRASHAIYVRPGAARAMPAPGEVPEMLRSRVLSLRAFDAEGMMVNADLAEGREVETLIEQMFRDPRAQYIHLHFAKPGCYAARVDRA